MDHHEPIGDREREAGFAHRAIAVGDGTRCRCGRPLDAVLHRGRHEISWALYWSPRFIDGRRRDG